MTAPWVLIGSVLVSALASSLIAQTEVSIRPEPRPEVGRLQGGTVRAPSPGTVLAPLPESVVALQPAAGTGPDETLDEASEDTDSGFDTATQLASTSSPAPVLRPDPDDDGGAEVAPAGAAEEAVAAPAAPEPMPSPVPATDDVAAPAETETDPAAGAEPDDIAAVPDVNAPDPEILPETRPDMSDADTAASADSGVGSGPVADGAPAPETESTTRLSPENRPELRPGTLNPDGTLSMAAGGPVSLDDRMVAAPWPDISASDRTLLTEEELALVALLPPATSGESVTASALARTEGNCRYTYEYQRAEGEGRLTTSVDFSPVLMNIDRIERLNHDDGSVALFLPTEADDGPLEYTFSLRNATAPTMERYVSEFGATCQEQHCFGFFAGDGVTFNFLGPGSDDRAEAFISALNALVLSCPNP